ncbi:hypothetical protein L3Q82_021168 [Scortum barcoo]|uniref:Uncharacterized protein n=1 Tax=Scortum barcoo TaxID=214431 RepID=A0ACB8X2R1_9TELE|nr:hypothetical protein L3Q82_021168 [Scortum barcoo]
MVRKNGPGSRPVSLWIGTLIDDFYQRHPEQPGPSGVGPKGGAGDHGNGAEHVVHPSHFKPEGQMGLMRQKGLVGLHMRAERQRSGFPLI